MNKIIIITVFFCITNCFSQSKNIIGIWKNMDYNYISQIEYKIDNTAILSNENNLASPPFELKIDYNQSPIWVDMQLNKDGIISEVFGLAEIIDTKTLKLEIYLNHNGVHPFDFSNNNDDSIITLMLIKVGNNE